MESVFTGQIIFLILLTVVIGFSVGFARIGLGGLIFLLPILMFFQAMILFSASYIQSLEYIGTTGAGGFNVGEVLVMHLIAHPVLLLLSVWVGRLAKTSYEADLKEQANQLTPEDITSMLNILGAHPDLAKAGWFPDQWAPLGKADRLRWTTCHLAALRELWVQGDGQGFDAIGLELPKLLAAIDIGE